MRWVAMLWVAALPALAQERKLAVLPISSVLGRADAAALEEAVRPKARELGMTIVEGASESVSAAADQGATHAVTGWPPPTWWPKPHSGARGRAPQGGGQPWSILASTYTTYTRWKASFAS